MIAMQDRGGGNNRTKSGDGALVGPDPLPAAQAFGPGYVIGLTRSWPASDLYVIESLRSMRVLCDCNDDGQDDTEVRAALSLVDLNGDGRIERDVDGLMVRPTDARVIDGTDGPLVFDAEDGEAAVLRVRRMLAGPE